MKKLVALLLSVMMCFACVSALADTYVSWYTYGDVYLSSVRSEMEADFAKLNRLRRQRQPAGTVRLHQHGSDEQRLRSYCGEPR